MASTQHFAQHRPGGGLFGNADRRWVFVVIALVVLYSLSIWDYVVVEHKTLVDATFETLCTSVYVDCGEFPNVSTRILRVLLGAVGAVVLIFLVSTLLENFLKSELGWKGMLKRVGKMREHYIVAGYGAFGKTVADSLAEHGESVVVIEKDKDLAERIKEEGTPCVLGSGLDSKTLELAGIRHAKAVIAALPTDADNVFLALSAREMSPGIKVASRAFSESAISKLHSAGAEVIVMPDIIGGLEIAKEILNLDESHLHKLVSRKRAVVSERRG
ncbi:MAG: NAD(P)-binding protein [Candidatus Micrarchaeia archaeon]